MTINSKIICAPSTKIKEKDEILINISEKNDKNLTPKNIKLDIIYEDNDVIIIDKPKGMVVHPGAGNRDNTLANALTFKYKKKLSDISGNLRPGIVHRIDKDTSGLLVIARNNLAHSTLVNNLVNIQLKKI